MNHDLSSALATLGLSLPFDRRALKQARNRAMLRNHPDLHGAGHTRRAQEINLAHDTLLAHVAGPEPMPRREQEPAPPPHSPRTRRPRRPRRGAPVDFRHKNGALWAGFTVPAGTPLPKGWRRAGDRARKRGGQPWTKKPGDAAALRRELEAFLARRGAQSAP